MPAQNLREQRAIDLCGVRRRSAQNRRQGIGNLAHTIDIVESLHHVGYLAVDGGVVSAITSPDNCLLIMERVPGKGNPGSKILLVGAQRPVLGIEFVTQAIVQCEVTPNLPPILPITRCERSVHDILGIAETLFVERGRSQAPCLKCGYGRWGHEDDRPHPPWATVTAGICRQLLSAMPGRSRNSKRPAKNVSEVVLLPRVSS